MSEENKNQAAQEEHPGFVEDDEGNRAMATPPEEAAYGAQQGAPDRDPDLLEEPHGPDVDPVANMLEQQRENFPRVTGEEFDPSEKEKEPVREGRAATSRSEVGRVVVVDYDCEYDGEIYKSGISDLPLDVADALIDEGLAWEPAGKKKGR